jgi:hypothetical protein
MSKRKSVKTWEDDRGRENDATRRASFALPEAPLGLRGRVVAFTRRLRAAALRRAVAALLLAFISSTHSGTNCSTQNAAAVLFQ